jgi:hypothetical protein
MASEGNGQDVLYEVVISSQNAKLLKEVQKQLAIIGKGNGFLEALRQIYKELRTRPVEFGEPRFRLPALKLVVYQGAIRPLLVDYAIHEEYPLVVIREFGSF